MIKPLLILSCGNPSRGDDALGAKIHDWIMNTQAWPEVEAITDFQLQVEHTLDIEGRGRVLFVDACVALSDGIEIGPVMADADDTYTSHAMTPASVLAAYQSVFQQAPPASDLLAIQGQRFELGEDLSETAIANLELAKEAVTNWVSHS